MNEKVQYNEKYNFDRSMWHWKESIFTLFKSAFMCLWDHIIITPSNVGTLFLLFEWVM